jgi:DNA-binding NarL/FixJ family response regulator
MRQSAGGDDVPAARVLIADDHPLFLEALKVALEGQGLDVVGTASRGDELLELAETAEADAVLLDLSMPGLDGFQCIARLRATNPDLALLVVSASDDEADIRRALDAGALCFVGKAVDPADLAGAVRILLSDSIVMRPTQAPPEQRTSTNGNPAYLTRRELEILRLTAQGLSNQEMARQLWVTEQTVKFHLSNIYRKTGAGNRTGASRWAQQHGLLD